MKIWQTVRSHPLVALELQRMQRKRWWPGPWAAWAVPVVLGIALGMAILWIVYLLVGSRFQTGLAWVPIILTVASLPMGCITNVVSGLGTAALMWVLPATLATSIVREREQGTLDLLRVTMLSTRSLLLGKVAGCVVRWWPLFVALALLVPFQIILASAGLGSITQLMGMLLPTDGAPNPFDLEEMYRTSRDMVIWTAWLTILGGLRPWVDIALHGMIGLFASVWTRSSSAAIAATYGAIIAIRAGVYLLSLVVSMMIPLVWLRSLSPIMEQGPEYGAGMNSIAGSMLLVQGVTILIIVLLELGAGVLLWWGAVRRMERE